LITRPDHFAVRLSHADGTRRLVYERLATALAPRALTQPVQPALLAVAMPLLRLVNSLPSFSKQTRQISVRAQAVRQAIREARSPDELLFERLPIACGLPTFRIDEPDSAARVDAFTTALREGLQELQDAYPQLTKQIAERIGAAFGLQSTKAIAHAELHARYALIAETTNDTLLRSLGVRLETADPDGSAWIESIAALVARRSPELWNDGDIPAFAAAIAELGRRFCAAEDLAIVAQCVPANAPLLRIGLANGRGELSRVVHVTESDPIVQQLHAELTATLGRYERLTTDQRAATLAALLQTLLEPESAG